MRDQAVFVGNPEDIVPERFASHLPWIREWTEEHYSFAGDVTGFDPADFAGSGRSGTQLSYAADEQVCIVTVGGSGVGGDLLRRVIAVFPGGEGACAGAADDRRRRAADRPRDPSTHEGLEARGLRSPALPPPGRLRPRRRPGRPDNVDGADRQPAPVPYFPLRHHFEQNFHVRHRLGRYGAGRCMDFESDGPDEIAAAIAETIGTKVDYRPVESDGAACVAAYRAAARGGQRTEEITMTVTPMTDRAAIVETVLDYFQGWFEGDVTWMECALDPSLAKRSLADDGQQVEHDCCRR